MLDFQSLRTMMLHMLSLLPTNFVQTLRTQLFLSLNRVQMLIRFGFPWIAEEMVLAAPKRAPKQSLIDAWSPYCAITYESVKLTSATLTQCTVLPSLPDGDSYDGLMLFYQGAGISVEKSSCLQNLIDMSLRCQMPVLAFNQRHVGSSDGYHYSSTSLQVDLAEQSQYMLNMLGQWRDAGRLSKQAKLYVYGLCQGGVLALCSVDSIVDHPDFAKIIVTRTPLSFSDMAAHVPNGDYRVLMPPAHRARIKPSLSLSAKLLHVGHYVRIGTVHLMARLLGLLPIGVRRVFFRGIFRFSRWHIDCRQIVERLAYCDKIHAIAVHDDEFISGQSDVAYFLQSRQPARVCVMEADVNMLLSDDDVTQRRRSSCAPFNTLNGFNEHQNRPLSPHPRHQAWSQHMVMSCPEGRHKLDEYQVVNGIMAASL